MANLCQPLPGRKELVLFNTVSQAFDKNEYEKGIKAADELLKLVPDHGETMSMKGLLLHSDGKKDGEDGGYAWIKKGIAACMRGSICWHSLGMCHRTDKQFKESMKAFKMAGKCDPNSLNIMRDISSMAIQLRDWDVFLEQREKMLNHRSNIRAHWLAVSAGHRMKHQYELASAIAGIMDQMLGAGETRPEISGIHLYRAELEVLAKKPHKAIEILKKNDKVICDPVMKLSIKAQAFAMQGVSQKEAAEKCYWELIAMGYAECDNLMLMAKGRDIKFVHNAANDNVHAPIPADEDSRKKFMEMLDEVVEKYPRCDAAKRFTLDACSIEDFEKRLVAYATPFVVKNIPSLASVLKSLYIDSKRVEIIGNVFSRWESELKENNFSSFSDIADPTYLLWVYMFLSTHNLRSKKFEDAHKFIDLAIAHTPTCEMLYLHKAKIFNREGKLNEAADTADLARLLDLQDKYLNGKAAKYFFRAGKLDEAETRMGLFYKATTVNDHYLTARDSQCAWYEKECGDCELARGNVYGALQNYLLYEKHQKDNHDTLIDFHNYAFRKGNVRSWLDLMEADDNFESRKLFLTVAPSLVKAYVKVNELGSAEKVMEVSAPFARPELAATEKEDEDKIRAERKKDFELEVDLSNPMEKAHRYVTALTTHRGNKVETHKLAIDFYTTWNKPILVCKSLNALFKNGLTAEAKELGAAYKSNVVASKKGSWNAAVATVVEETLQHIGA